MGTICKLRLNNYIQNYHTIHFAHDLNAFKLYADMPCRTEVLERYSHDVGISSSPKYKTTQNFINIKECGFVVRNLPPAVYPTLGAETEANLALRAVRWARRISLNIYCGTCFSYRGRYCESESINFTLLLSTSQIACEDKA